LCRLGKKMKKREISLEANFLLTRKIQADYESQYQLFHGYRYQL